MRLNINLASQPYEDARIFWRKWGLGLGLAGLVTLVVLVLAIHGALQAAAARQQTGIFQGQIAREEEERNFAIEAATILRAHDIVANEGQPYLTVLAVGLKEIGHSAEVSKVRAMARSALVDMGLKAPPKRRPRLV